MNKLLTALFAMTVACVTGLVDAQTPAASAQTPAASAQTPAAPTQAAKAAPADAKLLQAKVAMCIGCHGIKGYQASFPEVYRVPMIVGQSPKYIVAALTAYKNGDRKHPTMRGIAASLSEQDINDMAHYLGDGGNGGDGGPQLADKPSREPDAQVAALMKKAACSSCHGANLSKPIDVYPKIGGQHSDYLFAALRAYKMENNPTMGRNHPVMSAIAKQFSSAELKALSKYVGSLDGELRTMSEDKFR